MAARLDAQNAEAVFAVMVGNALNEAGQHFLSRWLRLRLHVDGRISSVHARRGFGTIATCLDAHILSITRRAGHRALDCVIQHDSQLVNAGPNCCCSWCWRNCVVNTSVVVRNQYRAPGLRDPLTLHWQRIEKETRRRAIWHWLSRIHRERML